MIGWKILKEGEYKVNFPRLSEQEEKTVFAVEKMFNEIARRNPVMNDEDAEETIRRLLNEFGEEAGVYLDGDQLDYLTKVSKSHIYGFLFFDDFLNDKEIEEISVIGLDKPIYVFVRKHGWKRTNVMFTNEETLIDVVNKMAKTIGRRITLQKPILDAVLSDGSRIHASIPPVSPGELTIRKFSEEPFSPQDLVSLDTTSVDFLVYLSFIMQADFSLILCGNTACGKTTTLNTLFSFVPLNERVIITEETPEINIPHQHQLRLVASPEMGVSLMDLVYATLRMRPDRMVVGEARNRNEVEALFDVLLAGQARGCYATFHAKTGSEALSRMVSMGIEREELSSIDFLLVQRRMLWYDKNKRSMHEVRKMVELSHVENDRSLSTIFSYQSKNNSFVGKKDKCLEYISDALRLSKKEFFDEFSERRKFFERKRKRFNDFIMDFQKHFYGIRHGPA